MWGIVPKIFGNSKFAISWFQNVRKTHIFSIIAFLFIFVVAVVVSPVALATAGINKQINFQGKVVNSSGTNVTDGNYNFEFKIYDAATDGSTLWTETRTGGNQVAVADGIFQVALGSVTSLPGSIDFNTDNIYLGINFNGDGEMTPRVRFTSVPQAFNAEKVSGLSVTNTTGTLTITNGKTISFADAFTTSGAFGLTLTVSGTTNATLPSGTITLADLATSQSLTNKTIGSTGLVFSGASTDVATVSNEDLTIAPNGSGDVILTLGNGGQLAVNATPTGDTAQDSFKLTLNPTITGSTATLQGLVVSQSDNANNGVYDSLLKLEDLKTPETTTNGLFVEHNAASGTLTNAVNITNTAGTLATGVYFSGTLTTGLDLDAANVTRELVLENGEAIINQSDDVITLEDDGGTDYATFSATDATLPTGAINTTEIADGTLDADDLDQATADGSPADEECLTFENSGGGDFEWQSCGAGGATAYNDIGDPTGVGSITFGDGETSTFVYTHSSASDQNAFVWDVDQPDNASAVDDLDVIRLDLTSESGDAADTFDGIVVNWENGAANTIFDSGLKINNAETTASTLTDAIIVTSTGVNNGVVDAIDVSDGNITNGINLGSNNVILNSDTINDFTGNGLAVSSSALTVQVAASADGLSANTSSGSGLEVLSSGVAMLQGCANNEVLKWNETSDVWACGSSTYSKLTSTASTNVVNDTGNTADQAMGDVDVTTQTATDATEVLLQVNFDYSTEAATSAWHLHVAPNGDALGFDNVACTLGDDDATTGVLGCGSTIIVKLDANQIFDYGLDELAGTSTTVARINVIGYWSPVTTGADLAEYYYTSDRSIQPGDVVSLDPDYPAGIRKSTGAYDATTLGVVSTQPGLLLGDIPTPTIAVTQVLSDKTSDMLADKAVLPIALAGRIPVNVSMENGPIIAGDLLTPSSVPGVAMKATKSGRIIGQALFGYNKKEVGAVMMFVQNSYSGGTQLSEVVSPQVRSQKGESKKTQDFSQEVLKYFLEQKKDASSAASGLNVSEMVTDRIAAGLEIISPRIVADSVELENISSSGKDIAVHLDAKGEFVISKENDKKTKEGGIQEEVIVSFDAKGDMFFAGGDIIGANKESLDIGELADGTFTFVRNDAGKVVITGADGKGAADTVFDTTGAGTITIGSSDVTSITFVTDGKNNIILPEGSVDGKEILNGSVGAEDLNHAIAGRGLQFVAGSPEVLAVAIIDVIDSVGVTESQSGLEFGGKDGEQFGLLQGCSDGQVLKWNDTKSVWQCAYDTVAEAAPVAAAPVVTDSPSDEVQASEPVREVVPVQPVEVIAPSVASVINTHKKLLSFATTSDIWDAAKANAFVTVHAKTSSVLVSAVVAGSTNDDHAQNPVFTLHRRLGGKDATCSDTQVGIEFVGTSLAVKDSSWGASATFVDSGNFTEDTSVAYTVCTSKKGADDGTLESVAVSLTEIVK